MTCCNSHQPSFPSRLGRCLFPELSSGSLTNTKLWTGACETVVPTSVKLCHPRDVNSRQEKGCATELRGRTACLTSEGGTLAHGGPAAGLPIFLMATLFLVASQNSSACRCLLPGSHSFPCLPFQCCCHRSLQLSQKVNALCLRSL